MMPRSHHHPLIAIHLIQVLLLPFLSILLLLLPPSLVNCSSSDSWPEVGGGFEPQFVPMDRNVTGPLGGTSFLTCRIEHLGDGTVSWVRQSDLHILTSGLSAYTSDSRFRAHHTSNDWILEIRDLKWTDAGVYECQVPSSDRKQQSQSVTLTIIDAEPVILEGSEVTVEEGEDIRLSCSVKKYSPSGSPVILWKKEMSFLLSNDPRVSVRTERVSSSEAGILSHVVIKEARIGDGGNYSCHAPALSSPPARTVLHVLQSNSGTLRTTVSYGTKQQHLLIGTLRYTVINIIIFFLLHSPSLLPLLFSVQFLLLKTFLDVT